jgi:hypothetical protein
MAGDEHQRQGVVEPTGLLRIGEAEPQRRAFVERIEPRVAAQPVERLVARRDREPGGRLVRLRRRAASARAPRRTRPAPRPR